MLQSLSNFQQRCVFGIIWVLVLACIIAFSHTPGCHYFFITLIAAIQATALWEYYSLAETKGHTPLKGVGIGFATAYIFLRYATAITPHFEFLDDALFFGFIAVAFLSHFHSTKDAIVQLAVTIFGMLYVTLPLSFLIDINYLVKWPHDRITSLWIIYLLLATKATDTVAYFVGKAWGKRPLALSISPKKTIEGAIGGFIGAIFITFIFFITAAQTGYATVAHISFTEMFIIGSCIGIGAQIGDLAESLLKRDANIKDSNQLPGFGGMLDMIDSLIFTTPLLYIWLKAKSVL